MLTMTTTRQTGDFISVAIYPAKSGYNRAKESEGQERMREEEPEREGRGGRGHRDEDAGDAQQA
jgi:hypothetical protein